MITGRLSSLLCLFGEELSGFRGEHRSAGSLDRVDQFFDRPPSPCRGLVDEDFAKQLRSFVDRLTEECVGCRDVDAEHSQSLRVEALIESNDAFRAAGNRQRADVLVILVARQRRQV